jgi:branched-chain amino acid transport system substrate-binding protein
LRLASKTWHAYCYFLLTVAFGLLLACAIRSPSGWSKEKSFVIGAPLATSFLYGWDAEKGIKLAVEEVNGQGGVVAARKKKPL